jgi:lipopolysaccharide heptosyltransferase II
LKRILLLRLRQIGDVVLTTPAVAALRSRFPHAHITYLVEPPAAPVLAGNCHIDEVIIVPKRAAPAGLFADLALGWRLRRQGYDLAIDFHGGPRASLLTLLSGASRRIGYNIAARSWMYTDVVDRPRELRRRHSVENQWDLLTPLGFSQPTASHNPVEMPSHAEARAAIARRLAEARVGPDAEIAVIHVSASSPFRRWPLTSFVETASALARGPSRRVILTSGPSEQDAVDRIVREARAGLPADARERIMNCGDFSLAELRALLERASLYIGGDSGPLHVAATTNVPIVAIFGPTPSERSIPWRDPSLPSIPLEVEGLSCRPCDQRVCVPGDFRCLTQIDAPRVIAAAERLLAHPRRRREATR